MKKAQPVCEDFKMINLGTEENPREIKIGVSLDEQETIHLTNLLNEFQEIFAWSYDDMPGVDPEVVQHHIPLYPKQKLRRLRPEWSLKVKEDIMKQLSVGFLEVSNDISQLFKDVMTLNGDDLDGDIVPQLLITPADGVLPNWFCFDEFMYPNILNNVSEKSTMSGSESFTVLESGVESIAESETL